METQQNPPPQNSQGNNELKIQPSKKKMWKIIGVVVLIWIAGSLIFGSKKQGSETSFHTTATQESNDVRVNAWTCTSQKISPTKFSRTPGTVYEWAADSAGSIYFADDNSYNNPDEKRYGVSKIDSDGKLHEYFYKTPSFVREIVMDDHENLYGIGPCGQDSRGIVTKNQCLYLFDRDGTFIKKEIQVPDILSERIFVNHAGNIFVTDNPFENSKEYNADDVDIIQLDRNGKEVKRYRRVGEMTQDILFDKDDNIFTYNSGNTNMGHPSISRIINGTIEKEWVKWERVDGNVAMDSKGNMFTAYGSAARSYTGPRYEIVKISPQGEITKADLHNPYPAFVDGIFVDQDDLVYVNLVTGTHSGEQIPPAPSWYNLLEYGNDLKFHGIVWFSPKGITETGLLPILKRNTEPIIRTGSGSEKNTLGGFNYIIERCVKTENKTSN